MSNVRSRSPWGPLLAVVAIVLCIMAVLLLWGTGRAVDRVAQQGPLLGTNDEQAGPSGVSSRPVTVSGSGLVRLRIVDGDGMPLADAALVLSCLADEQVRRIDDGVVQTDEEGWAEGPGCRGRVCVDLRHPAFVPAEPWVVRTGVEHELTARPLPRLHGVVLEPSGEPRPGARVAFVPAPGSDPLANLPLVTSSTTTDADGAFSVAWIERPPCGPCEQARGECADAPLPVHDRIVVAVQAEGFSPTQLEIGIDDDVGRSLDDPVVVELQRSADALVGRLVDPMGHAYPRAYVLARSTSRRHEQHRADVVKQTFELGSLGDGAYDLRALQDGVELATLGQVEAGARVTLHGDIPADGPDVVVEIRSQDQPQSGVVVDGGPFRGARTDMQGQVRATQVLAGTYHLRIRGPGRRPSVHEVTVGLPADGARVQVVPIELRAPDRPSRR